MNNLSRHGVTVLVFYFALSFAKSHLSCLDLGTGSLSPSCCQCTQHPVWYHCPGRCRHDMYPAGYGVSHCAAHFLPASAHHAIPASALRGTASSQDRGLAGSASVVEDRVPHIGEEADHHRRTSQHAQPPLGHSTTTNSPNNNTKTDQDRVHPALHSQTIVTCGSCHRACDGCTGPGPTRCLRCAAGFQGYPLDEVFPMTCNVMASTQRATSTAAGTYAIHQTDLMPVFLRLKKLGEKSSTDVHTTRTLLSKITPCYSDVESAINRSLTPQTASSYLYMDDDSVYDEIGYGIGACVEVHPEKMPVLKEKLKRQTSASQSMEEACRASISAEKQSLLARVSLALDERSLRELNTITCLNSYCDYRMPTVLTESHETNPKMCMPEASVPLTIQVAVEQDGQEKETSRPPLPPRNKTLVPKEDDWKGEKTGTAETSFITQETNTSSLTECGSEYVHSHLPSPAEQGRVGGNTSAKDDADPNSQITTGETITGVLDLHPTMEEGSWLQEPSDQGKQGVGNRLETNSAQNNEADEDIFTKYAPLPNGLKGGEEDPYLIQSQISFDKEDMGPVFPSRPDRNYHPPSEETGTLSDLRSFLSLREEEPSSAIGPEQTLWTLANLDSSLAEVGNTHISGPRRLPGFGQMVSSNMFLDKGDADCKWEEKVYMLDVYFKSMLTLTNCLESKVCRPVFSPDWQKEQELCPLGGVVQTEGSEVRLEVLPGGVPPGETVNIKAAISISLDQAYATLSLPTDEHITSPIAEYFAGVNFESCQPMRIVLRHFLPRMCPQEDVNVYVFRREPNGHLSVNKLTLGSKDNDKEDDTGTFRFVDDKHLEVFTNHFSGYLCTCKNVRIAQELHLLQFAGKTQRADGGCEVDVRLEIWDNRLEVKDFEQRGQTVKEQLLQCIDRQSLSAPEDHQDMQLLQIGCELDLKTEELSQVWEHAKRRNGHNIHPVRRTIPLKSMFPCECHRPIIPKKVDWKLAKAPATRAGDPMENFGALVDVGYVSTDQTQLSQPFCFLPDPQQVTIDVTVAPFTEEEKSSRSNGAGDSAVGSTEASSVLPQTPNLGGKQRSPNTHPKSLPLTEPPTGHSGDAGRVHPHDLHNTLHDLSQQDDQGTGCGVGLADLNRSGYVDARYVHAFLSSEGFQSRNTTPLQQVDNPSVLQHSASNPDNNSLTSSASKSQLVSIYVKAKHVSFPLSPESSACDSYSAASTQSRSITSSGSSDYPMAPAPAARETDRGNTQFQTTSRARPLAWNSLDGSDGSEEKYGCQNLTEMAVKESSLAQNLTEMTVKESSLAQNLTEMAVKEPSLAQNLTEMAVKESSLAQNLTEIAVKESSLAQNLTEMAVKESSLAQNLTEMAVKESSLAQNLTEMAVKESSLAQNLTEMAVKESSPERNTFDHEVAESGHWELDTICLDAGHAEDGGNRKISVVCGQPLYSSTAPFPAFLTTSVTCGLQHPFCRPLSLLLCRVPAFSTEPLFPSSWPCFHLHLTHIKPTGDEPQITDLSPPGYVTQSFPRPTRGGGIAFVLTQNLVDVLLQAIAFPELKGAADDDSVDSLNHVHTVVVLVLFALAVTACALVGVPMACWTPATFPDGCLEHVKQY
ncbi:hypothetical protein ACOMHN_049600 [Nucella lapillus]